MVPRPTPIYHITSISNLAAIVADGELASVNVLKARSGEYRSIAYNHIQDRRARTLVPCGPGGCLHDYVPFYFAPRSPMLYTISRGNVEGARQREVIYLASSLEAVRTAGTGCVFTDGHAIMTVTEFYTDMADLSKINWGLMASQWWNDTPDAPDRARQRQAEFLVHQAVPWTAILEIAVMDDTIRTQVLNTLDGLITQPLVRARRDWYY